MARARLAAHAALVLVLLLAATASASPGVVPPAATLASAVVDWPPSAGLLVAEVVTGGTSASDEYIELTNGGATAADLTGLEVVYATSSGATVTRKAAWTTSTILEPGRHLLLANVLGIYAASADATYSGGLAATGGAIVLRVDGGAPVDAVGWGDATNAFVEGMAAPAPPAGSSIERLPGGIGGNTVDTNANAADFAVNGAPVAQNLASPPVPDPAATPPPEPTPSPTPAPTATPTPTPEPTPAPTPTPTPNPTPTPTPNPTATPTPAPTPTPTPAPTPTPTPNPTATPSTAPEPTSEPSASPSPVLPVAGARALKVGDRAVVRGTVIAEAGRLGTPPLFAIADSTGGLPVKLAEGMVAPARGVMVEVSGAIAAPYGQTELRLAADGLRILGAGSPPTPIGIEAGDAGEATEGLLATLGGTISVSAARATSGDLAFTITGYDGSALRILADASAGLDPAVLRKGASATFTGIVGQRASRKGALDGYRLWLRDRADIAALVTPSPPATPASSPRATGGPSRPIVPIGEVSRSEGRTVTVEGVLTVDLALLDATRRRTVVEDRSGAIEVLVPAPDSALRPGARVRVTGEVGRAYGAPRLRADEVVILGRGGVEPRDLRTAPGAAHEWRLVRINGVVTDVRRLGDRWLAELAVGGERVPVTGLPGSGIPPTALVEGREATVVGIVRRPYPTATDRRFAVVPRGTGDVVLRPAAGGSGTSPSARRPAPSSPGTAVSPGAGGAAPRDVDIEALGDHLGGRVRVGGLVREVDGDSFTLDDGTGLGRVVLEGEAAGMGVLVEPGDALNAIGRPERRTGVVLVVEEAAGLVLVGDLGAAGGSPAPQPSSAPGDATEDGAVRAALARGFGLEPAPAGIGGLVLVLALSVLVTAARRHRARRVVQARIVSRLEAMTGQGEPTVAAQARPEAT